MPIKFPKGFTRRKSSGNVLEDIGASETNKRESTFRVLNRHEVSHDFDGSERRQSGLYRPSSQPLYGSNNRSFEYGPGDRASRTNNSSSTGENISDPRRSYASTTASSINYDSDEMDSSPAPYKNFSSSQTSYSQQRPPQPPPQSYQSHSHSKSSFSLNAGGRTFSFGPRQPSERGRTYSEDDLTNSNSARQRAATQSSRASTATPPKLDFGSELGLGLTDTEFGNGLGDAVSHSNSGRSVGEPTPVMRTDSEPLFPIKSHSLSRTRSYESGPEQIDVSQRSGQLRSRPFESPLSQSAESGDRLVGSPPVPEHKTSLRSVEESPSFEDSDLMLDAIRASQALELQHAPPVPKIPASYTDRAKPLPNQAPPPPRHVPTTFHNSHESRGEFVNGAPSGMAARSTTKSPDNDDNLFDSPRTTIVSRALSPVRSSPPRGPHRVMTPAQFEEYKQQKEMTRDDDEKSEESEESDDYEDEDEQEKQRQMAKQRRRQDAHLAVYRQQMKKVTGEQPGDLPSVPSRLTQARATKSTSDLTASLAASLTFNGPGTSGEEKSSDDEDEDVPLGVLQAHGFPSKNRPPTRIASASPTQILRPATSMSAYPAPPGSVRNESTAGGGNGGNLPPFARNLPSDPYIGASLVSSMNREPLSYNGGAQSSAVPPGGLVGVIAGEERAKAMRRGSPNAQGTYGHLAHSMGYPQQMAPVQPQMSHDQHAQMQMHQQMQQMMQMQMQWMQQMMQMGGMQGMPPMPGMPGMPNMPGMPGMPNMPGMQGMPGMPMGMPLPEEQQQMPAGQQQNGFLAPGPQHGQRATSMSSTQGGRQQSPFTTMSQQGLGLGAPQQQGGLSLGGGLSNPNHGYGASSRGSVYGMQPGYAPSMAPSERSNVGQPSRYRAVNTSGEHSRTSTGMTDPHYQQQNYQQQRGRSVDLMSTMGSGPGTTIRAVSRPKNAPPSDDEDEEGWAAMKKKREARKTRILANRNVTGSSGGSARAPSPSIAATAGTANDFSGMEGLYYEGPYEHDD